LNHQPEAQHPKSSAIHKLAGRLPHLLGQSGHRELVPSRQLLTDTVEKQKNGVAIKSRNAPVEPGNRHSNAL
jgi:hypothetical protein